MRAAMTTSRPQIPQSSEQLVQTFAVQGRRRTALHQRSRGRWQPEAFVAGKSSKIVQLEWVDTYADAKLQAVYVFEKS